MFTTVLLVIAVLVILAGIIRFLSKRDLLKPIIFCVCVGVVVYVCFNTDIHKRLFSKTEDFIKSDFTEFTEKLNVERVGDSVADVPPVPIEKPAREVRKYPGDTIYMPGASPEKLIIRKHRLDSDFPLESELNNGFDLMRNDTLYVLDGGYERIYIYPKTNN